jgi:hypothetical protein
LKNKILKTITAAAGVGIFFFAALLDSTGLPGRIALNGLMACMGWIALFDYANNGGSGYGIRN